MTNTCLQDLSCFFFPLSLTPHPVFPDVCAENGRGVSKQIFNTALADRPREGPFYLLIRLHTHINIYVYIYMVLFKHTNTRTQSFARATQTHSFVQQAALVMEWSWRSAPAAVTRCGVAMHHRASLWLTRCANSTPWPEVYYFVSLFIYTYSYLLTHTTTYFYSLIDLIYW